MSDTSAAPRSAAAADDRATAVFTGHRELLFSVVYNMLGGVADPEDVLQETWLAWQAYCRRSLADAVGNPRAYLVRIAVNQALARQAAISRRRETYVGQWLPEPLVSPVPDAAAARAHDTADPVDPALRGESVSMALLVVLQTLTPLERAVFVLHEVFGYTRPEIARVLDRAPAAVRQLAHRARAHVQARRPRYQADPRLQRQVTERFVAASLGGDLAGLMSLLAPDVTMWSDGGGKARSALRPVRGRENVSRMLTGYAGRRLGADLDIRYRHVNGDPSAVVFDGDSPYAVMVIDLSPDTDQVTGIYLVTNPDKLAHVRRGEDGDGDGDGTAPGTAEGGARRA